MTIAVCVKPVPGKMIVDVTGKIIRENKSVINPLDKNALEEALRIKEKVGGTVDVFSMGVLSSSNVLKDALSMGADNVTLISDRVFAGSDTVATSYVLSKAVMNYDLIICGNYTTDSATGQVPVELASKLDIPMAINVVETEVFDKKIKCKCIIDEGYLIVELTLPALISVHKDINEPRISTIANILKAEKREIKILSSTDLKIDSNLCGINGSPTRVATINNVEKNSACTFFEGSLEEQTKKLAEIIKSSLVKEEDKKRVFFEPIKNQENDIFVLCEISNNKICSKSLELLAKAYELSLSLNKGITAVVISEDKVLLNEFFKYGANKVFYVKKSDYYQEAEILTDLVLDLKPEIFLFGKTFNSKIISAFIAGKLDTGLAGDCADFGISSDKLLIQRRIVYGGTKMADIICQVKRPQMATFVGKVSNLMYNENNTGEIIRYEKYTNHASKVKIADVILNENLSMAKFIVACGNGVKNKEILEVLAKKLNGVVVASRKAVDNGVLPYQSQVGLTGKYVAPNVYLACGISGAMEHMIGINSNVIIAINVDKEAPIFKYANFGIVGDINEVIPLIIRKMEEK